MAPVELPQLHPPSSSSSDDREALRDKDNDIFRVQDNQQQSDQETFSLPLADKGMRAWAFPSWMFLHRGFGMGYVVTPFPSWRILVSNVFCSQHGIAIASV